MLLTHAGVTVSPISCGNATSRAEKSRLGQPGGLAYCYCNFLLGASTTLELENSAGLQPDQMRAQVISADANVKPHLLEILRQIPS